jgi:hypothetical protein
MNSESVTKSHPVYWEGNLVGYLSNFTLDMWYLDGDWLPTDTPEATRFLSAISHLQGRTFWESGVEALVWVKIPSLSMDCTVVHVPLDNRITFRMMINLEPPQS